VTQDQVWASGMCSGVSSIKRDGGQKMKRISGVGRGGGLCGESEGVTTYPKQNLPLSSNQSSTRSRVEVGSSLLSGKKTVAVSVGAPKGGRPNQSLTRALATNNKKREIKNADGGRKQGTIPTNANGGGDEPSPSPSRPRPAKR